MRLRLVILCGCVLATTSALMPSSSSVGTSSSTALYVKGYTPKWKKKKTLGEESGEEDFIAKGLKGSVSVVFRQSNETKSTIAMPGAPVRDVASQAGQFIKYGCGKGKTGERGYADIGHDNPHEDLDHAGESATSSDAKD